MILYLNTGNKIPKQKTPQDKTEKEEISSSYKGIYPKGHEYKQLYKTKKCENATMLQLCAQSLLHTVAYLFTTHTL